MKLKVCGLTKLNQIRELVAMNIDFLGFIFYEKSPRYVLNTLTCNEIKSINHQGKIGVFVNEKIEKIIDITEKSGLNFIQLHGDEDENFITELKQKLKPEVGIIKAIRVGNDSSEVKNQVENILNLKSQISDLLFDTDSKSFGGTGKTFDWQILNELKITKPYFLSGGISEENIENIKLLEQQPFALDINSKFEIEPGNKDLEKIKNFISVVNTAPKIKIMNYQNPDKNGYYGEFGGAFVPEMLYPNVEQLQNQYLDIINSEEFQTEFRDLLKNYVGRATPLYFSKNLSEKYQTQVYLKREDLNHTGAHKINNALGQVLLAKKLGKKRIIAETGAGQHGVATATACALMNLECIVYMGEIDIARQAPNVGRMKMLGATVIPATSGSKTLKDAVNEALRDWINNASTTHYIIGSVVGPHPFPDLVARFQSVISEEIKWQLKEKIGRENPDYVIACVGGGSNAAGTFYHFVDEPAVKIIAAEAGGFGLDSGKSAATTFLGTLGVLHGSKSLVMQTEDGQVIEPHSISAGLDYPGIGPFHANLFKEKRAEFFSITDEEALKSAFELTQIEGIIPALESAHALAVLGKKKFKKEDVVVICLSGRGDKDMETYLKNL
ncbi:tryptophan synthase subunit beta [Chryseobacterium gotjawalense]|uniref:Multifunctional fusion protein n=2 Tax=Chryseobacterium gotjawalense TaxID=3042315 RepID=A0ABY8RDY5_9FLAO|nr:tryptophan synthase subunit beta [Chryseobacterium sp. wdc7]WHF52041.1 tryptophan synthase subunit beta [Chryseobacterium sp. wdc7]